MRTRLQRNLQSIIIEFIWCWKQTLHDKWLIRNYNLLRQNLMMHFAMQNSQQPTRNLFAPVDTLKIEIACRIVCFRPKSKISDSKWSSKSFFCSFLREAALCKDELVRSACGDSIGDAAWAIFKILNRRTIENQRCYIDKDENYKGISQLIACSF